MSVPLLVAATLAAAAWPNEGRLSLVSAAAILVEALPFVLAGVVVRRILGRRATLIAYAGCGCTTGPSARSLPAAALTWIAFGPSIALARIAASAIVDRLLHRARTPAICAHHAPDLASELERLIPLAVAAAIGAQLAARVDLSHAALAVQIAVGAALGFCASPCAIGSIAVAAALRVHAAAAAASFLCVAGIVDFNAFRGGVTPARNGDAFAYALLAAGAGLVAYKHGADLVRPAFAPALAICAAAAAAMAIAHRARPARGMHAAGAIVLLGASIAAPPPIYRATETTLAPVFPGERVTFTGILTRDGRTAALERYAITCCRADAAPIVVRLARPTTLMQGTWARADGVIAGTPGNFALFPDRITPVPAPADPFLYR